VPTPELKVMADSDPHRKKIGEIPCVPYQEMLDELF
jgi:hypothetical protein